MRPVAQTTSQGTHTSLVELTANSVQIAQELERFLRQVLLIVGFLEFSSKFDLFPGSPELTFRASPSFLHVWMTTGVKLDELIQLVTGERTLGTQ